MKKFEIGKEYTHGYAGDHTLYATWKVIKRTAQTITITNNRETKTCKINKALSEMSNCELVFPDGRYSMCPILRAE